MNDIDLGTPHLSHAVNIKCRTQYFVAINTDTNTSTHMST